MESEWRDHIWFGVDDSRTDDEILLPGVNYDVSFCCPEDQPRRESIDIVR